jgi:hypothetical protein
LLLTFDRSDDGHHTRHEIEESLRTAGTLSDDDDESNGSETASGSEISQHPDDDMEPLPTPEGGRNHQEEVTEDCPVALAEGSNEEEDEESKSRAPIDTLSIPTPERILSPSDLESSRDTKPAPPHSSLLSSLDDELIQSALESVPTLPTLPSSTSEFERQQQLRQQQEDDEFAAITLQRMRSLRQRILDSIQHPPPPPLGESEPNTPTDAITVLESLPEEQEQEEVTANETPRERKEEALGSALLATEAQETETPVVSESQSSSESEIKISPEITSLPSSSSLKPALAPAVAPAAAVEAVDDDDEPRERSCTVDSDDEIDE